MPRRLAVLALSVALALGLSGCMEHLWPFHGKAEVRVAPPALPVEKIGPDVIAVPVEPVVSENMMDEPPPEEQPPRF